MARAAIFDEVPPADRTGFRAPCPCAPGHSDQPGVSSHRSLIAVAVATLFCGTAQAGEFITFDTPNAPLFADYLAARGIDVPTGWILRGSLSGVSGDGSVVVGWGGFEGGNRSFVVTGANGPVDHLFN